MMRGLVRSARSVLPLSLAAGLLVASVPAAAGSRDVSNLKEQADVRIVGGGRPTHVETAGDVNGDGIPDLLVAKGYRGGDDAQGRTWVLFGRRDMPARIDLSIPATVDGFMIEGADDDDLAYESVGAGDINGDGLDDVIVGAPNTGTDERPYSGTVYVVFGKTDHEPVLLALFDAGLQDGEGYRIDGPAYRAKVALDGVAGLGDMNGDGLSDILISAPFIGRSYVVYGQASTAPFDLAELEEGEASSPDSGGSGPGGFRIETPSPSSSNAYSVTGTGDVNGDGIPDLAIGVIGRRRGNRLVRQSSVSIVFGKSDAAPVNVRRLGDQGYTFKGANVYWDVASAGDVNADGLADVVVGAPFTDYCCGQAYVLFGRSGGGTIWARDLRPHGYRLAGGQYAEYAGDSVSGGGDVNGDGFDDVLVAATGWDSGGGYADHDRPSEGRVYLVQGKSGSRPIDLGRLRGRGYRMDGGLPTVGVGFTVAGLPDINGDGVPESFIGSGLDEAYVVWGRR